MTSRFTPSGSNPPQPRDVRICQYQDMCRDYGRSCWACENNTQNQKQSYFKPVDVSSRLWGLVE